MIIAKDMKTVSDLKIRLHSTGNVVVILLQNVRGEVSLLAFGTKARPAGDVPKVPQGQGLAPPPG